MKALKPAGHVYELQNSDGTVQVVNFMRKEGGKITSHGTTNEEVLAMMIDRVEYLDGALPCDENKDIIDALKKALHIMDIRTAKRMRQGIEGQDIAHK